MHDVPYSINLEIGHSQPSRGKSHIEADGRPFQDEGSVFFFSQEPDLIQVKINLLAALVPYESIPGLGGKFDNLPMSEFVSGNRRCLRLRFARLRWLFRNSLVVF